MSHIDTYDGATWVYTFGPGSFMTVLFVILAIASVIGFLAMMTRHENHAYAAMLAHEPVEPGPAVEGEPQAY
ncbi:hypothetical protein [Millisia brevis]|uniref:hypothetical protein n=1 Tax=Millisia brevis TaxID=264148 RepID=UPI000833E43A|nr:hypothetical protein [Millisia brevis]